MTISKDLFLSIFAMDSYNRGYGEGIKGLGGIDSKIGSATIKRQSGIGSDDESVVSGFYALSYTVGAGVDDIAAGTTVIAYRGTDSGPDYTAGWSIGKGNISAQT